MEARRHRTAVLAYAVVFIICVLWTGAAVLTPVFEAGVVSKATTMAKQDGGLLGWMGLAALRGMYHFVCHQIPERSFWIDGRPMAVCARCFGIYSGCLLGLLIYPLSSRFAEVENPPRVWLILSLVPVGVDFLGGYLGVFQNTDISRAITGLIAGFAAVFYVMPGLVATAANIVLAVNSLWRTGRRSYVRAATNI